MIEKIKHAKKLIKEAVEKYSKIAVACSFGKDSMVTLHLARQIKPDIRVFSIMTMFKPRETFEYLCEVNRRMNLDVEVYMVADYPPDILKNSGIKINLLPTNKFKKTSSVIEQKTGKKIYQIQPDECCRLLKVEPAKEAVKNLDAWICGLRNTEGRTRKNYREIEHRGGLVKVNPILEWTEIDVWRYIAINQIPVHPWYVKGYRSLGCAPCTIKIGDNELERAGRWAGTSKCGGECGIHTQKLKD